MYAYLDRPLRHLPEGDLFLLSAMRNFVAASHRKNCVCAALSRGFAARAAAEALPDFVTVMTLLGRNGREPMHFAPIVWPKVTDDEARILALFALGQEGAQDRLAAAAAGLVADEAVPQLLVALDMVSVTLAGGAA